MARERFQIARTGLDGIEAVFADSRHSFARHTHETYGIGLIERGAQKSASGRGLVEAAAGNTITVNPGEVHDGAPLGDAPRAWRMLYLEPAIVREMSALHEARHLTCVHGERRLELRIAPMRGMDQVFLGLVVIARDAAT